MKTGLFFRRKLVFICFFIYPHSESHFLCIARTFKSISMVTFVVRITGTAEGRSSFIRGALTRDKKKVLLVPESGPFNAYSMHQVLFELSFLYIAGPLNRTEFRDDDQKKYDYSLNLYTKNDTYINGKYGFVIGTTPPVKQKAIMTAYFNAKFDRMVIVVRNDDPKLREKAKEDPTKSFYSIELDGGLNLSDEEINNKILGEHAPYGEVGQAIFNGKYLLSQEIPFLFRLLFENCDKPNNRVPNFLRIIMSLKGFFKVLTVPQESDQESHGIKFNGGVLKSMVWVHSDAQKMINNGRCYILDASFFATKPYVYAIFLTEYAGVSYPFCVSIGTTENADLFQYAFEVMKEYGINMVPKPAVTDLGGGIKKFCCANGIVQFWCQRHWLELFNPNSFVGRIVARLMKCQTSEEFYSLIPWAIQCVATFQKNQKKLPANSDKLFKCLCQQQCSNDEERYKYNPIRWAAFGRIENGLPTTSNYLESLHGHINHDLPNNNSFNRGINTIFTHVFTHIGNRHSLSLAAAQRSLNKLKKIANSSARATKAHYFAKVFCNSMWESISDPAAITKDELNQLIIPPLDVIETFDFTLDFNVSKRTCVHDVKYSKPLKWDQRQLRHPTAHNSAPLIEASKSLSEQEERLFRMELEAAASVLHRELLVIAADVARVTRRPYTEISHACIAMFGNLHPELKETVGIFASELAEAKQLEYAAEARVHILGSMKVCPDFQPI